MRYVGIDLAWGTRNTTAAVALEKRGDGLCYLTRHDALTGNDSVADFVQSVDNGGGLMIGVDAPTRVPNTTGRRPCEAILSRCMRVHEAGAHPANRQLLAGEHGGVRGETLTVLLHARLGVTHTPHVAGESPRTVFEVFPHPAHIALFDLAKTLKYKRKPGRDRAFRDAVFRRYTDLLHGLQAGDPALVLPDTLTPDPATVPTEVLLKRHEDFLDAVTCAYVAAYHHRWHGTKSVVVGDTAHGYIVTPATDAMKQCFGAAMDAIQSTQEGNGGDTAGV